MGLAEGERWHVNEEMGTCSNAERHLERSEVGDPP